MRMLYSLLGLLALNTPAQAVELTVKIQGAVIQGGLLKLGLFDKAAGFPTNQPAYGLNVEAKTAEVTATFSQLPAGHYALAVFQDSNNNQKLDTHFFGIPTELYGFSRAEKAGQPAFEAAAFDLSDQDLSISIQLR